MNAFAEECACASLSSSGNHESFPSMLFVFLLMGHCETGLVSLGSLLFPQHTY